MTINTVPVFPGSIKDVPGITFVAADGQTKKDYVTAGANGTVIENIPCISDDTAPRVLEVYKTSGGTDYKIGEINIPASTGTNSTLRPLNLLSLLAAAPDIAPLLRADGTMLLAGGGTPQKLRFDSKTTVTAAKTITIGPATAWDY